MGETTISWTQRTWNPIRGCSMAKGSEKGGCLNCYAARQAARNLPGMKSPTTGKPFAIITPNGPRWKGPVELIPNMLQIPVRRRIPTTYFVNSMSDLFHESLPFEEIDRVFTSMVASPWHTYQILTKRADRMLEYFASGRHDNGNGPDRADYHLGQKIWLGVSVEHRENIHVWNRIDLLRRVPASVRFLSLEPLLGDLGQLNLDGIHWVIVGGESGPGARPCNIEWIRAIVTQCKAANVPCFVKQLGANVIDERLGPLCLAVTGWPFGSKRSGAQVILKDRKGGNPEEWPADLRLRQMPEYHP